MNKCTCRRRFCNGRRHRRESGAVTIYVFAVAFFFAFLSIPVIAFFANASTMLVVQSDTAHIATQVASVVDDYKYWLGARRPGYDESQAKSVAIESAHVMCDKVGMTIQHVQLSSVTDTDGTERTVCDLRVDARKRFPVRTQVAFLNLAESFPGIIQAQGQTVHTKLPPYALIHMDAPMRRDESTRLPLGFNQRDVAIIPSYGFFYNAVAGERFPPTEYGKGISKMAPENFMAMNHYHFKKSDIEYALGTGEDVFNNSWHPGRAYDGKEVVISKK